MSENLPIPVVKATPVLSYTGALNIPFIITTHRNASIVNASGIIHDDPNSIALDTLDYKDVIPGTLLTLSCNHTHLVWGSTILSQSLTSASFPNMVMGGLIWTTPALASISLPELKGTPTGYGINITSSALVDLNLPKMEFCNLAINIIGNSFQTVSCPELIYLGSIVINSTALKSVSLPKTIQIHDGINIVGGSDFKFIEFGTLQEINGDVTINGTLPENIVDNILISLANLSVPIHDYTITLQGNNAHPSAAGGVAKIYLENNGNIVNVN